MAAQSACSMLGGRIPVGVPVKPCIKEQPKSRIPKETAPKEKALKSRFFRLSEFRFDPAMT